MKKNATFILLLAVGLMMASCEPEDSVTIEDLDLVVTNHNPDFNFKAQKTYAMPDSVILINGEAYDGSTEYAKPAYATTILNAVKNNMRDKGWILVNKTASPYVIILPSVSQTTNVFYTYSYSYWGGYYPGYSGGWGWYYPGYYYPPTVSSYQSGSLFLQMTYPGDTTSSDLLPVEWTCIVNGLLEGSTASIQARITTDINQAFKQSPYLKQ